MYRIRPALFALVLILGFAAGPAAALRAGGGRSAVESSAEASAPRQAGGFQDLWQWFRSLFGAEHGTIVP